MTKKKNIIQLEFGADQKGRVKPKQKKVDISIRLDEDIAAELFGGYPFDKMTNDDRIRHLAPLIWKQLDRVQERWQRRPGGSLDPDR